MARSLPVTQTDLDRLGLKVLPFTSAMYSYSSVGGAAPIWNVGGLVDNPYGFNSGVFAATNAGANNGLQMRWQAVGRRLGFVRRATGATGAETPATFVVDGEAFEVKQSTALTQMYIQTGTYQRMQHHIYIPDRDFGPGQHVCEFVVSGSQTTAKSHLLYGYVVDAESAVGEGTRSQTFGVTAQAVPTSAAGLNYSSLLWLRRVLYHNTTAGALSVTWTHNGTAIRKIDVPANSSVDVDFGAPFNAVTGSTGLQHVASGSGLVYSTQGGVY